MSLPPDAGDGNNNLAKLHPRTDWSKTFDYVDELRKVGPGAIQISDECHRLNGLLPDCRITDNSAAMPRDQWAPQTPSERMNSRKLELPPSGLPEDLTAGLFEIAKLQRGDQGTYKLDELADSFARHAADFLNDSNNTLKDLEDKSTKYLETMQGHRPDREIVSLMFSTAAADQVEGSWLAINISHATLGTLATRHLSKSEALE